MKKLGRMEMKKIKGGISSDDSAMSCCVHTQGWGRSDCGNVSVADAQALARSLGWMWCCSSCDRSRKKAGIS